MKEKCDLCGKENDDLKLAGSIRVCPECKILENEVKDNVERKRKIKERKILSIILLVGGILIALGIVQFLLPPLIQCTWCSIYDVCIGCENVRAQYGGGLIFWGILIIVVGIGGIMKIIEKRRKYNA
jgi:hypothetical protein